MLMKQSVDEIRKFFQNLPIDKIATEIENFKNDERVSVRKIVQQYKRKYTQFFDELKRLDSISSYENNYYKNGINFIAGVDEVGRGPLAGPVVAAAVVLPKNCRIFGIDDSKKLSEKKETNYLLK